MKKYFQVLAVGIVNADQAELEYIASSQQNVYTIDNFDALRRLKNELRQDTCGMCICLILNKNHIHSKL